MGGAAGSWTTGERFEGRSGPQPPALPNPEAYAHCTQQLFPRAVNAFVRRCSQVHRTGGSSGACGDCERGRGGLGQ